MAESNRLNAVRSWVLRLSTLAEVLEPAGLRRTLAKEGRRLAALYIEADEADPEAAG